MLHYVEEERKRTLKAEAGVAFPPEDAGDCLDRMSKDL
jgi:hypothetical protein